MRIALEQAIEQKNWTNAATSASDLSRLHVTLGNLRLASEASENGITYAEFADDGSSTIAGRTALANALVQGGDLHRAKGLLNEAEALKAEIQPDYPKLDSIQGYQYCDLLLTLGQAEAVRKRALQTLDWAKTHTSLLAIALDHLSLGRAALALEDRDEARNQLDQAVDGLREAGQMQELPRGLLARAASFLEVGEFPKSRHDLDEAMRIAERGGMRLFKCDAHLEYVRLALAEGNPGAALPHFQSAQRLVEDCGYHRRDPEIAELKEKLGL